MSRQPTTKLLSSTSLGKWPFPPEIRGGIFLAFLPVLSDSAILSVGFKPCLPPVAGVGASVSQVVSQLMVFNWRRADRFRVWNLSRSSTTHLPTPAAGFSPKAGQRSRPIPSAGAASLRFLDALKCGRLVRNLDYASSPSLTIRLLCGFEKNFVGCCFDFAGLLTSSNCGRSPARAPPGSPSEPRSQSRSRSRTRPFAVALGLSMGHTEI
ncbi:hypothetical protein DFH08DRAFT_853947 [Mycena albidolilacea]|uniref:Uncharacterized protein n=1 Tax=Mycena albidolilacea TaxID=1033008 RepID=A0AAD7EWM2_9AGAR|nr:hypothetical protein DFH08DRAFT_853947 [Mycena albidolilacea]